MSTKVKKSNKKALIKRLDAVFSRYIRSLGSKDDWNECYTCGVKKPISQLQCGHFITRRNFSTRWNENNCKPQCVKCNMFEQGNQYIFGKKLEKELGSEKFRELMILKNKTVKIDYESELKKYE